jgi:predicted phosphodiesterase
MKFHLVSDTHVDHHNSLPIVHSLDGEYAILAGDIGNPYKDSYREYLKLFS